VSPSTLIFIAVFVVAAVFFGVSCFRRFRLVMMGKPEDRFHNIGRRIWNVVIYPFVQRCAITRRYRFGLNHAVLFWCFLVLLIANVEFVLHGLVPDYISLSRLPAGAYYTLAFIFDLVSVLAFLAVIAAIIRRLLFPPKYIVARSRDAFVILGLVASLMVAFFLLHGSEIAAGKEAAARYMPVSGLFSTLFSGFAVSSLPAFSQAFWWLHALIFLTFLNYLPYSKHMHIMTAIPNVFFRSLGKVVTQPREEFKRGSSFGVERVDQFTWKALFDSYSCTECGRCTDQCPAAVTGKPLNPRLVMHDIKANLLYNGPRINRGWNHLLSLIGGEKEGSVAEEVIWECTTCGACVAVCPVFIEQFPRIIEMRRNLVEMHARFPQELLALFENMEQRSNPWGIAPADRVKWAAGIDVKPFEAGKTEYLLYVGCAGAFDARSKQVTVALAGILNAAGVSWGILGKDEKCCGDSLRRLGNEFVFDRMARENVKMFQDKGIKKVITQCPHCFSTLKNDYRQYGADLEVVHHTELISRLLKEGSLKLNRAQDTGNIVFHDSCYLGRYNDVYEAPREAIAAATGRKPTEMKRKYDKSFCCGGGGGRMWMEEAKGKRINIERIEEALSKDPGTICVCCPYCLTMFEDGVKDKEVADKVRVLDLAEIVAKAMK